MRTAVLFPLLLLGAACAVPPPTPQIDPALTAHVEAAIAELGPGVRAAVWLSPPLGSPRVAIGTDEPMPVASAIKVGYLVELFAAFPDALDAPLPDAAVLLADEHPAVAHFPAAMRQTARQALATASVRRIGEAMITGKGVDNATYNIAANVVTAHFGGPAGLLAKLHARDPSWRGLQVRRYMLADRTVHGDNEATARSLAAVHGMLARGSVPGVDARAIAAARAVLARADDPTGRKVFAKGGSLDSDPVTRVEGGWHESTGGTLVHVVMLSQSGVAAGERAAAGKRLAAAAKRIEQMLVSERR